MGALIQCLLSDGQIMVAAAKSCMNAAALSVFCYQLGLGVALLGHAHVSFQDAMASAAGMEGMLVMLEEKSTATSEVCAILA